MSKLVLSIDQGTTGSRAFVFAENGKVVSSAYREFKQYYPRPGWVEHDPFEILKSVLSVVREAAGKKSIWDRIGAIGITNQRETLVMWDARSGRPVYRAIVWQCRRTAPFCEKLRQSGIESVVRRKTGLVIDPYFSGTKIRWLLDNVPGLRAKVRSGNICFGTIDSWLLWNLTGGVHATDFTNASRTLLYNIRNKNWDLELLRILGVPKELRLPEVRNCAGRFGETRGTHGWPAGIPVAGMCGDQQAALFGNGATAPGEIKNTYGTGCFLMLHTGDKFVSRKKGILTTLACDAVGRPAYALEGAIFIAGAAIQWLRDELKLISTAAESEKLALGVKDSCGVVVVPAFTGLGAPYWRADARGAIFGLTRGAGRSHIVRAALESIAFQTNDVFEIMKSVPVGRIKCLRVDGGATRNDFLMQFQADLLGIPVIRPRQSELTAWGAAKLAGLGAGLWRVSKLRGRETKFDTFRPEMSRSAAGALVSRWKSFVRRLL